MSGTIILNSEVESIIRLSQYNELLDDDIFGDISTNTLFGEPDIIPFSTYILISNLDTDLDISILSDNAKVVVLRICLSSSKTSGEVIVMGFLFNFNPVSGIKKLTKAINLLNELGFTVYNEKQYIDLGVNIRNKKVGAGVVHKLGEYQYQKSFLKTWN